MPEVIVIATLVAQEGQGDAGAAFLSKLLAPTHQDDACLLYALHRGLDDPRRFTFVERWASRSQLEEHLSSPEFRQAMETIPDLFETLPDITTYEPAPAGDPRKASLAGASPTG